MIELSADFYKELLVKFPYTPTNKQRKLLQFLSNFIFNESKDVLFLLKGYAGTGKTTTISAFVNSIHKAGKKSVLLAPTGRAAKVIALYAKKEAFTIHKKIYFPKNQSNGSVNFVLQPNKHKNTFFIVDEASMISDGKDISQLLHTSSLLEDLLNYVQSGSGCKLILIGDTAQLPPVKTNISPALDAENLIYNYHKQVIEIELDEVTRQRENSGILANATLLRGFIQSNETTFTFRLHYTDLVRLVDSYDI